MSIFTIPPKAEVVELPTEDAQMRKTMAKLLEDLAQQVRDGRVLGLIAGVVSSDGAVEGYSIGLSPHTKIVLLSRMLHGIHRELDS